MINRLRQLRKRLDSETAGGESGPFALPRAAAAQLLIATGAGATLEYAGRSRQEGGPAYAERDIPAPLVWAPLLVGSLTALAHLEYARRASDKTAAAVRVLDAASLGVGAALFLGDLLTGKGGPRKGLSPLAFASAGLLGITLQRQERLTQESERELVRRAAVVERLVPRRKARLDRIVVHV